MRKQLHLLFLLAFLIGCSEKSETPTPDPEPQPVAKADFRRGTWGDTKATVLKKESEAGATPTSDTGHRVSFSSGTNVDTYIFTGGKLDSAQTVYPEPLYTPLTDYYNKRTAFRNVFGNYKEHKEVWQSESIQKLYANKPADQWATAITIGYLSLYTTWETERSVIVLSIGQRKESGPVVYKTTYASR